MKAFSHSFRLTTATVLAMLLGSYVFASEASAGDLREISRVNQGITIEATEQVGDVSSVNGGIRIADGASAFEVSTINGSITLGNGVQVSSAHTVNGRIRVGSEVTVQGSLETVNGGIRTDSGTQVEEAIETVNGSISIHNTQDGEDIETANGDIDILNGSFVNGDIIVWGKRHWWNRFFELSSNRPGITIDGESRVMGDIHLYQEVDLNIARDAVVGEIIEHF